MIDSIRSHIKRKTGRGERGWKSINTYLYFGTECLCRKEARITIVFEVKKLISHFPRLYLGEGDEVDETHFMIVYPAKEEEKVAP